MCRHLAYLGPSITLDTLLLAPEHSLLEQGRAPRHQESGESNPDGYGIGWYDTEGDLHVHRSAEPIWSDPELPTWTPSVHTTAVMAAVRLASPGSPIEVASNAPYDDGHWQFSLNGIVRGYHKGVGDHLRALITPERAAAIRGTADTGVLFAMTLDRLDAGASPGEALAAVVEIVKETNAKSTLNLLLTDGQRIAATVRGNSLFVNELGLTDPKTEHGGVIVSSEPFDDNAAWTVVPEGTLVEADGASLEMSSL